MQANKKKFKEVVQDNKLGAGFIVLSLYFFFEYIRPQTIFPFLQPLKIPMILTIILFFVFLKNNKDLLKDRLVVYVFMFVFLIGFSVTYAVNTFHVWDVFRSMAIIFVCVILVMPVVCAQRKRFDMLIGIWINIHLFLALYGMTHSGHGPGGFLWDENDFALALNMCIPLSFYLMLSRKRSKRGYIYQMVVTIALIIGSGSSMSRGGFLGLVAVFGMIWLMSERKFKKLGIFMLCAVLAGYPVYKLVPESFRTEMHTILDDKDSTRVKRLDHWGYGWEMFLDNPVLGVGAKNYPWRVVSYQERAYRKEDPDYDPHTVMFWGGRRAHSLYFTLIPELGLAGIILFVLILRQVFSRLRRIIRLSNAADEKSEYALIAKALLISTVAYLVTGAFISVLYYPVFWYLVALVLTLERVVIAEYQLPIEKKKASASERHSYNRDRGARWGREYPGANR